MKSIKRKLYCMDNLSPGEFNSADMCGANMDVDVKVPLIKFLRTVILKQMFGVADDIG